jgi:hypothetical protein
MKKAKTTITGIFCLMLAATGSFAQSEIKQMPAAQRAELLTLRMDTSLKLDSVQKEKVSRINLKYAQKMDPVIQGTGSKMSRFKAFRSISSEKEAELKSVLTKDQFAQFQQQQQEMNDELRARRKAGESLKN